MTDDKLIDEHDRVAVNVSDVSPRYCLDELFRREQRHQTEQMLTYTNWIKWFTLIVMISTIISVIAVFQV